MTQHVSITIRKLDPKLKRQLRLRAAAHGRSMEEEARHILRESLATSTPQTGSAWVASIRKRFAAAGYVDLEIPDLGPTDAPPHFE